MSRPTSIFLLALVACWSPSAVGANETTRAAWQALSQAYLDEFSAFSPVAATSLGDHRYDEMLDNVDAAARARRLSWYRDVRERAQALDASALPRADQVDLALLQHSLEREIWEQTVLREWQWNPLVYTGLCGDSLYALLARDETPLPRRLRAAIHRMEQFPRFLRQVRETLLPRAVPSVHAKTAVAQNRGVLKIIENMIDPHTASLPASDQVRMQNAKRIAREAIETHQRWLEATLLPAAQADYRLGETRYQEKLRFRLHSARPWREIRTAAEARVLSLHQQMFALATPVNRAAGRKVAPSPSASHRRDVIRFALEQAYRDAPKAGTLVAVAKDSLKLTTDFLRKKDLITLFPDPLEIVLMPEFRRGVSVAYCDSPGPLDVGQKTFYVVSPIPKSWSPEQAHSFLREYNTRSLHVLTIHEAMPGHFLQIAHANRYAGRLRHLFRSGVFVEGWACYTEWMMCEEGFLEGDPLMKLITLKWYLRDAMNAILDSAVHVDGISREEAMRRMTEDAFQEEREAAGKWTRAQLTSAQLSTYFVGYLEWLETRRRAEAAWGRDFQLEAYHDRALSFGAPPPQFARALLLDEPIPKN